jgi:hypothetical protein
MPLLLEHSRRRAIRLIDRDGERDAHQGHRAKPATLTRYFFFATFFLAAFFAGFFAFFTAFLANGLLLSVPSRESTHAHIVVQVRS